jgi:hypothetical protein
LGVCSPYAAGPITSTTINDTTGAKLDIHTTPWLSFPQELEVLMSAILKPYGYNPEGFPDSVEFFFQIEDVCRNTQAGVPWAIIFFPEEYPLTEHLLSIRPNRDIKFSAYSIIHPMGQYDPEVDGAPPLSIIFVHSKAALMRAAATNSPLLKDAWALLGEKDENGNWVVIADHLDSDWVYDVSKGSGQLTFDPARVRPMQECEKELVSMSRFVALMNEELKRAPWFRDGMQFVDVGTGYDFLSPILPLVENRSRDKEIFDRVSENYSIARPLSFNH